MAFEAFRVHRVLDLPGRRIEALCFWEKQLLVAIKDGSLLFVQPSTTGPHEPWQVRPTASHENLQARHLSPCPACAEQRGRLATWVPTWEIRAMYDTLGVALLPVGHQDLPRPGSQGHDASAAHCISPATAGSDRRWRQPAHAAWHAAQVSGGQVACIILIPRV